jgi:hypothetical protein
MELRPSFSGEWWLLMRIKKSKRMGMSMGRVKLKKSALYKQVKYGTNVAEYIGTIHDTVLLHVNGIEIKLSVRQFNKDWGGLNVN